MGFSIPILFQRIFHGRIEFFLLLLIPTLPMIHIQPQNTAVPAEFCWFIGRGKAH
jgi:hypothetical protein